MVPTFRSDVRVFLVRTKAANNADDEQENVVSWFGGGADLTPYYLFDDDIREFHGWYRDLCHRLQTTTNDGNEDDYEPIIDYSTMKQSCDEYFYLPARAEHHGTGGIFFDDLTTTHRTYAFTRDVTETWMKSWFPIVQRRMNMEHSPEQREWQLIRREWYLEFNLLYDRGVRFGLAGLNPRVEGVMVSAPPLIRWEYNWKVEVGGGSQCR